jgi:hypothetical protein
MEEMFGFTIGTILIAIVIFLLCREIVCWYWKINKRITLLENINENLTLLVKQKSIEVKGKSKVETEYLNDENLSVKEQSPWECRVCHKMASGDFCVHCGNICDENESKKNDKSIKSKNEDSQLINKKIWNRKERMHGTISKIISETEVEVQNKYGKYNWKIEDCDMN